MTEKDLKNITISNILAKKMHNDLGFTARNRFMILVEEQIEIYGRNEKAVREAIRICKDKNILKEYLESRESEVMDMLDGYYSQEEVNDMIADEAREEGRREGEQKGEQKGKVEVAINMAAEGLPIETIARIVKYPVDTVKMWVGGSKARV